MLGSARRRTWAHPTFWPQSSRKARGSPARLGWGRGALPTSTRGRVQGINDWEDDRVDASVVPPLPVHGLGRGG